MASYQRSYHLLYFLLWPFFTTLYYLKNFRKPAAKNVMWLFIIFYGFTWAIGVESQTSDINSYVNDIPLLHKLNLNLNGILAYYYSSGEIDILRTVLAYIVSYFTGNGYYLIIIYGAIFGYFYSRNMWYILDRLKGRTKFFTKILLFCLFLCIPPWHIAAFRFWTASHVFIFGLLPFLFEGKKKSLIWCLITPFVIHFSFLFAFIPLAIYLVLGNKVKLYYIFFVLTLFVSAININQFNEFVESYAPEKVAERSAGYRDEEKVTTLRTKGRFKEDEVWYVRLYGDSIRYSLAAFLIVFYWTFRKSLQGHSNLLKLLSFVLLFYGFANVLATIPSGNRFLRVANLLSVAFLVIHVQNNFLNKHLYRIGRVILPFLLLFIIVSLRESWYSFSLMTIIGNPITAIFSFGENLALNDIIKNL